jgi:CBS domain-containing protein
MSRRDAYFDAMVRQLGAAYYQALHGDGSAAEVARAVESVDAEVAQERGEEASPAAPGLSGAAHRHRAARWRVSDVMTAKAVSVSVGTGYKQIARLLSEHRLSALPVLNLDGSVAGMVSEADLLRKQERHHGRSEGSLSWRIHPAAAAKAEARTAATLMTAPAVTIGPDAPVGAAARLMNSRHLRRLPVVDQAGKLVGIVGRSDLLSVFLRPDEEIAAEAGAVLTDVLLQDASAVKATAREGVLTLTGQLGDDDLIRAAVRLVTRIDGVVAVNNQLHATRPA